VDCDILLGYIGFNVRRAMQALRRSFFDNVGAGEVRPGQASLLETVARNPGASQIELSAALGFDKATIVALIDSAEEAGWLTRRRATDDRRRHELVLTRLGEQFVTRLRKQTMAHEQRFRALYTEQELANFLEYLQRLYRE
jgi:DNA-binding MarR family transcriptional regulator